MSIVGGIVLFAIGIAVGSFATGMIRTVMRRPSFKPMDHGQLQLWTDEY